MNFTVLISVYAINPYQSLEGGLAWNIVRALDQKFRLIVVTHPHNRKDIEHYLSQSPEGVDIQAQFEYYAPPFQRWGPTQKSAGTLLHKYLWHWGVVSHIRRRALSFDLAHHLNFPCGWCPSFLWRLDKPFIWGPVGYSSPVPAAFIRPYGWIAHFQDSLCWRFKRMIWSLDPFIEISAKKAAHVFASHTEAMIQLGLSEDQTTTLSALPSYAARKVAHPHRNFKIVCAGPFSPLSGFDVAIRAFALFYQRLDQVGERSPVELVIIGKGKTRKRLEKISAATGIPPGVIQIIDSEDPVLIEKHFSESKVYFSPTHDYMDRLLPQALAHGLPVACFDQREISRLVGDCCGLKASYGKYEETVAQFADHLQTLFLNPELRQNLALGARKKFERQLTWAYQGDALSEVYWNVFHRNELWKLAERDIA